ncbi:hypothetical protein KI688_001474 [Linnemannia hyalina]|uniref:Uncharacterized protein n=1 Tax=Linnemannia hyalina TaxID=64524 RepID=A0A9P7XU42_9FUNG|nr:hypothetical protein KI688_001474 [Linnemannia hyalina]
MTGNFWRLLFVSGLSDGSCFAAAELCWLVCGGASEYFSPENQDKLNHLTPMMDIPAMVEAFARTAVGTAEIPNLSLPPAQLLPTKSMAPQAPQQPQELQEALCVPTGSISAGSSRSSKSSSNCKLTASALLRLPADFAENFKKFTGMPRIRLRFARAVLEARPGELLQELNGSERAYLALFAKDPKEVGKLLDKS